MSKFFDLSNVLFEEENKNNVGLLALSLHYKKLLKSSMIAVLFVTFIFPISSKFQGGIDSTLAWHMSVYMMLAFLVMFAWAFVRPFSLQEAVMVLPMDCVPSSLTGYRLWLDEYYTVLDDSSLEHYLSLLSDKVDE